MASHISFVISGLLLVLITLVVQSVPIEKAKEIVQPPSRDQKHTLKQHLLKSVVSGKLSSTSTSSQSSPTIKEEKNDNKKKRNINDDQFDGLLDSESSENDDSKSYLKLDNNNHNHVLHTKIQEIPVQIHNNADKPVDTDDSIVFSDIKMTPNELTDIVRRRRDVKLNIESNQRRKRALSPYDFYDTDSLYDPYVDLIEGQQYVRPVRSFAPLYWYPSVYERNIREALAPSFYQSSDLPRLYSSNIVNDESDEDPLSIYNDDEDEDVNDYEFNRYPILLKSSNTPYDNLQLQQRYNTDDLPINEDIEQDFDDDDDDDEDDDEERYRSFYQQQRPYYTRYGSVDTYFD